MLAVFTSRALPLVCPQPDKRKISRLGDLCADRLQLNAISNAVGYAKFFSRSHNAVIRVYDEAGNVIETHERAGSSKRRDVSPQGNKRNHELVNVCRGVSAQ